MKVRDGSHDGPVGVRRRVSRVWNQFPGLLYDLLAKMDVCSAGWRVVAFAHHLCPGRQAQDAYALLAPLKAATSISSSATWSVRHVCDVGVIIVASMCHS